MNAAGDVARHLGLAGGVGAGVQASGATLLRNRRRVVECQRAFEHRPRSGRTLLAVLTSHGARPEVRPSAGPRAGAPARRLLLRSAGTRSTFWRGAAALLLALGLVLSARALYLRGKAALAGVLLRRAWAETLRTAQPTRPWPWADTHPVGRLLIPSLGYDEVIVEGASPRNLAFGPARLMNAAALGEPGNVVLAGHRTSWFQPLEHVGVGDALELVFRGRDGERQRTYRVAETRVVDPRDTSYLQPTARDQLTLVTCYPFGRGASSPWRYVVRAVPAGADHAAVRAAHAAHAAPRDGPRGLAWRPRRRRGAAEKSGSVNAPSPHTASTVDPDHVQWFPAAMPLSPGDRTSHRCRDHLPDTSLQAHRSNIPTTDTRKRMRLSHLP